MSGPDPIAEGREAQALMDNRLLRAVLTKMVNDTHSQWEASGAREADKREQLYIKIQVVRKIESEIRSIINSGKIAEQEMVEAEAKRGRPAQARL